MQPYIFPYLGYFQLLNSVDHFVFYDDVNFIKGGWVNRNQLLINNQNKFFTVPLKKISSFTPINEVEIHKELYPNWRSKFYKSLSQSYGKTPYYDDVLPLLTNVFDQDFSFIYQLSIRSVVSVFEYLNVKLDYSLSSEKFKGTKGLDKADRIMKICEMTSSNTYINPSGGTDLYDKKHFLNRGFELKFIKNNLTKYNQFGGEFIAGLSILDLLMFNSKETVKKMINNYELA